MLILISPLTDTQHFASIAYARWAPSPSPTCCATSATDPFTSLLDVLSAGSISPAAPDSRRMRQPAQQPWLLLTSRTG